MSLIRGFGVDGLVLCFRLGNDNLQLFAAFVTPLVPLRLVQAPGPLPTYLTTSLACMKLFDITLGALPNPSYNTFRATRWVLFELTSVTALGASLICCLDYFSQASTFHDRSFCTMLSIKIGVESRLATITDRRRQGQPGVLAILDICSPLRLLFLPRDGLCPSSGFSGLSSFRGAS
ncbi:hypothetical protein FRC08_015029 [Ceratobasidium sp. 394]|nr:hypothetical protein FRC08_015029 [Ceratobasidium sp. 394]